MQVEVKLAELDLESNILNIFKKETKKGNLDTILQLLPEMEIQIFCLLWILQIRFYLGKFCTSLWFCGYHQSDFLHKPLKRSKRSQKGDTDGE